MPSFWKGHILPRQVAEELTGQELHPDIFTVHPTGNLIHVVVELPPEEIGRIVIPETERGKEQMGIGYVIAAGPRAGHTDYATPGPGTVGVIAGDEGPEDLLGLHVIFGAHVGMPLRVSFMDREFKSSVLVMNAKDIRGVDENQRSLTERVVEKSKE